ncbi:MAG: hypothetical protein Q8S27_09130 [Hoeflea sp.]|nr:hypothetical protein [Hoeflea sp.]
MDNNHVTLAIVVASFAAAVTYVKANTAPLGTSAVAADIFACQQVQESQPAPAFRLTSGSGTPVRPACPILSN